MILVCEYGCGMRFRLKSIVTTTLESSRFCAGLHSVPALHPCARRLSRRIDKGCRGGFPTRADRRTIGTLLHSTALSETLARPTNAAPTPATNLARGVREHQQAIACDDHLYPDRTLLAQVRTSWTPRDSACRIASVVGSSAHPSAHRALASGGPLSTQCTAVGTYPRSDARLA